MVLSSASVNIVCALGLGVGTEIGQVRWKFIFITLKAICISSLPVRRDNYFPEQLTLPLTEAEQCLNNVNINIICFMPANYCMRSRCSMQKGCIPSLAIPPGKWLHAFDSILPHQYDRAWRSIKTCSWKLL